MTARALASSVATVPASSRQMRVSILPPSRPRAAISPRRVGGEAVVELEAGALQAAAVHRADRDLAVERAEEQQVVEDVGRAEHPVDAGSLERGDEPLEQVAAAGHRGARAAHAEGTSCRVVGGDEQHPAVLADERAALAGSPRGGDPAGLAHADLGEVGDGDATAADSPVTPVRCGRVLGGGHRASSATVANGVAAGEQALLDLGGGRHRGRALELAGDDRTCDVGELEDAAQVPALEQAVAQRAAEGVAGPEAVDDLDGVGRHLDALVAGRGEHPLGPLLDDGELDAALEQRVGGPLGVGLADGDLALLAVADGDGDVLEGAADLLARLGRVGPEHRAVVEVEHGVGAPAAGLPGRGSARPGSAPATAR